MSTQQTYCDLAYKAGYCDARRGRVYRDNYSLVIHRMKLDAEYDAGWNDARGKLPPKLFI